MTDRTDPAASESDIWRRLEQVLIERRQSRPANSYVTELLDGGHPVLAGKIIEEAYELVEACGEDDRPGVIHEAADLMFHVLVLLQTHDVRWCDVEAELSRRFGLSGLAEKASRSESPR